MRIAIVGAGIMGSSTALALAERGHDVALFEQFDRVHDRGSSHGRSRIIRKAYPDAFYTAIMDEAYGLWHGLQAHCDRQMVFEPGLLYFGRFESPTLRDVLSGLQSLGVRHELLDHERVRSVFPRLRLREGEIGIFTPEAGWVDAELAVRTTQARFADLGGILFDNSPALEGTVDRIDRDFDRHVLCVGPWVRQYLRVPVSVTLQTFGYVAPESAEPMDGPVWIEDCDSLFYGFPSEPGSATFKIGVHEPGAEVDPRSPDRIPDPDHADAIRRQAALRFGADRAEFTFKACLYTSTANEDFVFGRSGEHGFFVSACSGHGFKFGPWIGRKMADFVEERDAPENHPRFCWPEPLLEA